MYLFASRFPLLVFSVVLDALEEHVSPPLRGRVARLQHRIGFERALRLIWLVLAIL